MTLIENYWKAISRHPSEPFTADNQYNPRDKKEFYELYQLGLLGNRARAWSSYEELVKSGWRKRVCMRVKKGVDRSRVRYNIPFHQVKGLIKDWERYYKIAKDQIRFNQSMPDEDLLIQGEIMRFDGAGYNNQNGTPENRAYLDLVYTTIKKPMLEGLSKERLQARGLTAKMKLVEAMDPSSYEDINLLLTAFPNSVIEFSTYSVNVGNIPNRNTVIWEVRNY